MTPVINNDINSLSPLFRIKFNDWRKEVIAKYPNAKVFEARRSQERQNRLYAQGRTRPGKIVTRTTKSNHKDGNAVDIIFTVNGKPTWSGPYDDLITMAKKYGIRNLKPKETCHFEDDGTPYRSKNQESEQAMINAVSALQSNSSLWNSINNIELKNQLNTVNNTIRQLFGL